MDSVTEVGDEKIHILHVDDEPDLAELTATYLTREDDRFSIELAPNVSDGLGYLSENEVDCVISDYDMPDQNGIDFLEIVRDEYPDLPFILFTGKGSEEVAADAISAGVTDYLQKEHGTDQYTVLANRARNAVEHYRSEREAEHTRKQLQAIADNSADTILMIDAESRIRFANAAIEDHFGYTPTEIQGKPLTTIMPERHHTDHLAAIDRYLATGEQSLNWSQIELPGLRKDGTEIPLSISFSDFEQGGNQRFIGIIRNISELREKEAQVRERDDRLQQITENIREVVWMSDPDEGNVFFVNQAYEEVFGRSIESLYDDSTSFIDGVHHMDRDRVKAAIDTEANGGYDEEYRVVRPDGEVRWVRDRAVPVENGAGEVTRIVGIASDITDRKEREARLSGLNETMQQLMTADTREQISEIGVEAARDVLGLELNAIHLYDDEQSALVPVAATEAVTDLIGEAPAFTGGDSIAWRAYKQGKALIVDDVNADPDAYNPESPVESELHLPLGSYGLLMAGSATAESFDQQDLDFGKILAGGITAALENVEQTEHLRASEQEHRETKRRLELVLEGTDTGIWEWKIGTGEIDWNDTLEQSLGLEPGSFEGTYEAFAKRVHPDDRPRVEEALDQATETDELYHLEFRMINEDGNTVWAECPGVVIEKERGPDRMIGLHHDITERKHREKQLETFASIVSHDLRNPLNVATGYLELAQEDCESDYLNQIEKAHTRMDALIEDLLTLAQEGDKSNDLEPVDLAETIESCWENVATAAATLTTNIDREIRTDRSRLQQLLENLMRNAVEHGGDDVTVTVGRLEDGFYVEDDGPGIPKEDREDVFEAGYSTTEDGTGFGLSIVKQVADAHGWTIHVTEGPEGGARFEITGVEFTENHGESLAL